MCPTNLHSHFELSYTLVGAVGPKRGRRIDSPRLRHNTSIQPGGRALRASFTPIGRVRKQTMRLTHLVNQIVLRELEFDAM